MKSLLAARIIACITFFLIVPGPASFADSYDFREWKGDSRLRVTEAADSGDYVALSYDAPDREPLVWRAASPIALPAATTHVRFWFARQAGDFDLALEVRDSAGVIHYLPLETSRMTSSAVFWNNQRRNEWSMWNQAESPFLRAPDAAELRRRLPEDRLKAAAEAIWPQPLRLTGIRITPAKSAGWHALGAGEDVKLGRGKLWLTNLTAETRDGFEAKACWHLADRLRRGTEDTPCLFPDDLTSLRGTVRYSVEIRDAYFGPVVWQTSGQCVIDSTRPMDLFASRVKLPALPVGRYFVDTKAWRPDGTLEREQLLMRLTFVEQAEPIHLSPQVASFQWSTDRPNNVFQASATVCPLQLTISADVWKRAPESVACHVKVIDRLQRVVLEQEIPAGEQRVTINPAAQPGEDYFAFAEIRDGQRVLDRIHLHYGVATPEESAVGRSVPSSVPNRDEFLKGRADLTGEYWYGRRARSYPWICNMDLQDFDRWAQMVASTGASILSVGESWSNHEVLPGVYQWRDMEEQIAIAKRYGLRVVFRYTADASSMGAPGAPLWLSTSPARDQNGELNRRTGKSLVSYWDPAFRYGQQNYYRKLATHFLDHPDVQSYGIRSHLLPAVDYGDIRFDYSRPAQSAFEQWLTQQGKTPRGMGRLLAYPSARSEQLSPDLSEPWRQFTDFNTYTIGTAIREIMAAVRSVDTRRRIDVDQKPFSYAIESIIPDLKNGGALKNEGSPEFGAAALRSMCRQAGVPYIEELHNHLPTSRSIADATDFWGSYHTDTLFWLLRGRPALIHENPLQVSADAWSQDIEKSLLTYLAETRPHWTEWLKARQIEPDILVFGSRAQGLQGNRRMGAEYDIGGMDVFNALFNSHQLPADFADEYSTWTNLSRYKMILASGRIMTQAAIERLCAFAAAGGKLVIVDDAGQYCSDGLSSHSSRSLRSRLEHLSNVHFLNAPQKINPSDWASRPAFSTQELDGLLVWAGVERRIRVESSDKQGFACQFRQSEDGNRLYVATMRLWTGWYHGAIEREDHLEKIYGRAGSIVHLWGVTPGKWRVEQFHRTYRDLGLYLAENGALQFQAIPALAGEVQLFRITRIPD